MSSLACSASDSARAIAEGSEGEGACADARADVAMNGLQVIAVSKTAVTRPIGAAARRVGLPGNHLRETGRACARPPSRQNWRHERRSRRPCGETVACIAVIAWETNPDHAVFRHGCRSKATQRCRAGRRRPARRPADVALPTHSTYRVVGAGTYSWRQPKRPGCGWSSLNPRSALPASSTAAAQYRQAA